MSVPEGNEVDGAQNEDGTIVFQPMGQGISPTDILTAAGLLDYYPSLLEGDGNSFTDTEWLWDTSG